MSNQVKLLIIEDDPLISRMYKKAFGLAGYEVEMANDGKEGLEKAKEMVPTLILMDIMMPEMNGFEVLEKIKINPKTKDIPVIVLSNLSNEQDAENALSRGAVRYIVKSEYEPKAIVDLIKEVLAGYTRDDIPRIGAN